MARLNAGETEETEKKKPVIAEKEEIPYPSKSRIIRETAEHPAAFRQVQTDKPEGKHLPVIEKQTRSFSIKDIIAGNKKDSVPPAEAKP